MPANPVVWFEIYVQDIDRAKKFYQTVLGVQLTQLGDLEMWAFPSDAKGWGSSGAIVRSAQRQSGGNSTLVYFHADDCAVEGARVNSAGGKLVREKISIGEYGFVVLAEDTEGNMFGIHSMK